jgi:hypothetical protein
MSNGRSWRHTAAHGSGAVYRDADNESAALFDERGRLDLLDGLSSKVT